MHRVRKDKLKNLYFILLINVKIHPSTINKNNNWAYGWCNTGHELVKVSGISFVYSPGIKQ